MESLRTYLPPEEVQVVVYHQNCADGFGGAFAGWKLLGDKAEYYPLAFGNQAVHSLPQGKNVVMVDICLKRHDLERYKAQCKKLIVLDHHKSSLAYTQGVPHCLIDMGRSGAVLGWHYFHGDNVPVPMFLRYIEDRDLWNWRWPDSKAFTSFFYYSVPFDFSAYNEYLDARRVQEAVNDGTVLHKFIQGRVRQYTERACILQFFEHRVQCVNSTEFVSDIGAELASQPDCDFAAVYYTDAKGFSHFSLRAANNRVDVSHVAEHFGGGGHKNSAGFVWKESLQDFKLYVQNPALYLSRRTVYPPAILYS